MPAAGRPSVPLVPLQRAAEGQYRPGPYYLPVTGGWLDADVGNIWNWWQCGYDPVSALPSAIVEACVSAYAQTTAMLPGDHWRATADGGRERVTTSALSRILRFPNAYQSPTDFMLYLVRSLYVDGNAYALALRNDRFEVDELHLMHPRQSHAMVAPETGDIFYNLGGNEVIRAQTDSEQVRVPLRDVLHIRLNTDRDMLHGESPLKACLRDIAVTESMTAQQQAFYTNMARPSAVLSTDMVLDKDQVTALRDRWNEQAKGLNRGGVPILTSGLKVQPWTVSAEEMQLADMMKLSEQHIALAFRIPLQILGLGGSPFSSTEALMQFWIATSLGFCLDNIEEGYGRLFQLDGEPDEYMELDTSALLRSSQRERIEGLARGVQGGIYSPNEARAMEDLKQVKYGDEPRVQQQVVPLSAAAGIPSAPAPGAPASAAGPPLGKPPPADTGDKTDGGVSEVDAESTRRRFREFHVRALSL